MFRSSLILALVLSLVGLGVAPEVLCAEVCPMDGQCACCAGMSVPRGMQLRQSESQGPVAKCDIACTFFKAPLQTPQSDGAVLAVPQVAALASHTPALARWTATALAPPLVQDTSPPTLRSLLCTFRI